MRMLQIKLNLQLLMNSHDIERASKRNSVNHHKYFNALKKKDLYKYHKVMMDHSFPITQKIDHMPIHKEIIECILFP